MIKITVFEQNSSVHTVIDKLGDTALDEIFLSILGYFSEGWMAFYYGQLWVWHCNAILLVVTSYSWYWQSFTGQHFVLLETTMKPVKKFNNLFCVFTSATLFFFKKKTINFLIGTHYFTLFESNWFITLSADGQWVYCIYWFFQRKKFMEKGKTVNLVIIEKQ